MKKSLLCIVCCVIFILPLHATDMWSQWFNYGNVGAIIEAKDLRRLEALLERGVNLKNLEKDGYSLLMDVENNFPEAVPLVLKFKPNLNFQGVFEMTPLMQAIFKGAWDRAQTYIRAGADVNLTDYKGCTALMMAVQEIAINAASYFTEESKLFKDETSFGSSDNVKIVETIEILIKAGANPMQFAFEFENPILNIKKTISLCEDILDKPNPEASVVATCPYVTQVHDLLQKAQEDWMNFHPMSENDVARYELLSALNAKNKDRFSELLDQGFDVNTRFKELRGNTLLILFTIITVLEFEDQAYEVDQDAPNSWRSLLMKHNPDLNLLNDDGETALMSAVKLGKLDRINFLLNAGANPLVANQNGETALSIAKERKSLFADAKKVRYTYERYQTTVDKAIPGYDEIIAVLVKAEQTWKAKAGAEHGDDKNVFVHEAAEDHMEL